MSTTKQPSSNRPYLLKALFEWLVDNELTPYVIIDQEEAQLPIPGKADDAQIVLNISPAVTPNLSIGKQVMTLTARFQNSEPMDLTIPISSVIAIYSKEHGEGMLFTAESDLNVGDPGGKSPTTGEGRRDHLSVIN